MALGVVVGLVATGVIVATLGGGAGSQEDTLPTLPPAAEDQPQIYDDEGCVVLDPTEAPDCSVTADELDQTLAGPPGDEFRTLEGFVGPRWTTDLSRASLVVLEDTVQDGATESGTWAAQGLVRNETGTPQAEVQVTARLLDAAGAELATAGEPIAVHHLRPGEPAPFVIEADVPADDVASVEWSASGTESDEATTAPLRAAELATYWTELPGPREPIDVAGHEDPSSGPAPFLLFGSLTGLEGADLSSPEVVAAWSDEGGRVVHVTTATVVEVGGDDPLDALGADGLGDFVLVVDDPVGADLLERELSLWAVGS